MFKDIIKKESAKKIKNTLEEILLRTDHFRKEIDDINKNESGIYNEEIAISQMSWHNDIIKHLKNLHDEKDDYFNELKAFLK